MKCNAKTEVYSRVCGYFRPVSRWNVGKKEEFNDRKKYNVQQALAAAKAKGIELLNPGYDPDAGLLTCYWTKQDVIDYGKAVGVELTQEDAAAVLKKMECNYDAAVGYNWDTVGLAISEIIQQEKEQIKDDDQTNEMGM